MLSPDELIGQKVWLQIERDPYYYGRDEILRIKAELTQPTSPPWFYARYLDAPDFIQANGQWLTLSEAQQAFLIDPVIDDYEDWADDGFNDEAHWDDCSRSNWHHS